MTPEERLLVHGVGLTLINNIAAQVTRTVLYGAVILIFLLSTFTLLKRGLGAEATRILFATTTIGFLLTTMLWLLGFVDLAISIKSIFVDSAGVVDRATLNNTTQRLLVSCTRMIINWVTQSLVVMSDGVVVWRTWVICAEQRWSMLAPCALLVGTIGTSFTLLVMHSVAFAMQDDVHSATMLEFHVDRLFNASLALSLATNVASTLLILLKLWNQIRFNRQLGIRQKSTSPVLRVMLVLIESGFMYCGIQSLNLIVGFVPYVRHSAFDIAGASIQVFLTMATAMYPSIIILLVSQQRSMVETFGFTTQLKSCKDVELECVPSDSDESGRSPALLDAAQISTEVESQLSNNSASGASATQKSYSDKHVHT
ncbi:hypothetical protein FPV67DRAFT_1673466 [Lyophyllum atratum]|nr:hypothetical protein FPV67DRAFT_1673466 [Lyophyllum atratum]